MAFAAGSLWATLVVIGKRLLAGGADPFLVVGFRAALAFLLLGLGLALARPRLLAIRPRDIPFFLAYGVIVAANYGFYFVALKYASATMAVLLTYTYPTILAVLAVLFLGERLDAIKVVALVLTLAGCLLVVQVYAPGALRLNLKGALAGLGAAFAGAVYSAVSKRAVERFNSWTLVLWGFGFGALTLLGSRAGLLGSAGSFSAAMWGWLLLAAVVPTLLAYMLFTRALVEIEATRVAITASIEPVVAAGLAWVFLGERMEPLQWLGAVAILAGVLVVQVADQRRAGRSRPQPDPAPRPKQQAGLPER